MSLAAPRYEKTLTWRRWPEQRLVSAEDAGRCRFLHRLEDAAPPVPGRDNTSGMKTWSRATLLAGAALLVHVTALPASGDDAERWVWPLQPQPEVVRSFEPPVGPYAAGHRGVDLAGTVEAPVRAVADGVIRFAGMVAGKGVVVVDHGAERSTYQPISASVRRGDTVEAGDVIGRLQLGGSHCWPDACLHLGRVAGEVYLDPLALLGGGPVRLLPLDGPLPPPVPRGPPTRQARTPAALGLLLGSAA